MLRSLSEIDMAVIHCAATPNGLARYTVRHIDYWHKKRGFRRQFLDEGGEWGHVGYHYVVHTDGSIHQGRGLRERGAHAVNYNGRSVGICLIGRDAFTYNQWESLRFLVDEELPSILPYDFRVVGHNDLARKYCPGFDVHEWYYEGKMEPLRGKVCDERKR